ncbi:tail tape measure protein [Altererythrobacter lauratis]|uniref:Tail tape measure protein n=1 Tax=Alteraurantiacibacter lauratis TaxID=2054627 RepID=A0ABV7EJ66_9SPHN
MEDSIETLMVDVRANTQGFRADVDAMRTTMDRGLVDGFERAGQVLERGLLSAIRNGRTGFDDLKRVALSALNEIASQAVSSGIASLLGRPAGGGGTGFGLGSIVAQLVGSAMGLPGRATGGPVSPGRAYLVGERGPEMFVPTSAGRVEAGGSASAPARDVRVSISLAAPRGSDVPGTLRRSSRQVAAQVRRALDQY